MGHVQITFDSGFHRPLTLTEQLGYRSKMHIGPQPETVKDYTLSYQDTEGEWHAMAEVTNNFQRLRRHAFEPVTVSAIKLSVTATHGVPEARVYEVRCYG